MKKVVFYGIDLSSIPQMADMAETIWHFCVCEGIILEEERVWGVPLSNVFEAKKPSDINKLDFDTVILFAKREECQALRERITSEFGVPDNHIVDYQEFRHLNTGNHSINWHNIGSKEDIHARMRECRDLSELEKFYYSNNHRTVEKSLHYLEIYDRHFSKYRGSDCVLVEVGVYKGGSLQLWKHYLGDQATVIGVDIDETVKTFEEEQIHIEIGSQSSREFWAYFREKYPKVDIFIDDGGHTMEQQIVTFEEMFPHVAENGVYLCEDLHTSYWQRYGGGYNKNNTFIEYSKRFIDDIHAWYSESDDLQLSPNTRSMHSLHFYDSVLVIEKRKMYPPAFITTGTEE